MAESQDSQMDSSQQEKSMDRNQRYVYTFMKNIIPDETDRSRLEKYCCHVDMPFQAMIEVGLAVRDGLPDEEIALLCTEVDRAAVNGSWQQLQRQRIISSYWNVYADQITDQMLAGLQEGLQEIKNDQTVTMQGLQEFVMTSDRILQGVDRNILKMLQQNQEMQENILNQLSQIMVVLKNSWTHIGENAISTPAAPDAKESILDQQEQQDQNLGGMVFVDEEELDASASEEYSEDLSESVWQENTEALECVDMTREEVTAATGGERLSGKIKEWCLRRKMITRAKKNALSKEEKEKLISLICAKSYDEDQMRVLQHMIEDIHFNGSDMEKIIKSSSELTAAQIKQKIDLLRQIKQNGKG